jgi:hypothetical protein
LNANILCIVLKLGFDFLDQFGDIVFGGGWSGSGLLWFPWGRAKAGVSVPGRPRASASTRVTMNTFPG